MLSKASLVVILPVSLDKTKYSSFIGLFGWWWINVNTSHGISIQLSPDGEVNSGGYIPRCEASRYISTAVHLP